MTEKTTANEPVEAIDPGGTRQAKTKPHKGNATAEQKVESGDRNTMPGKQKPFA